MIGPRRSQVIGLSLILAVLCVTLGQQLTSQPGDSPADRANPIAAPSSEGSGNTGTTSQRDPWLQEILSRPLFNPDRRPAANIAGTIAGLPRLSAIIVQASRRTAIFAAPAGTRPIIVGIGSHIGAYTVQDIADNAITVTGPQGANVIHPSFDTTTPMAEAPIAQRIALPAFFKVPP